METTIAILMYLSVFFSGDEYHIDEYENIVDQYQQEITAVENDPEQMQIVEADYVPIAGDVTIYEYDDDGNLVIVFTRERN